jgi:putrescine---pyruvate transaminase
VTSGYMPLGGLLVGERVRSPFWDEPIAGAVFRHGYTYSGHSGAAAAALANLDILEREQLVARVASLEPVLDRAVRRLEGAPLVGEIRTVGLTAAVALKPAVLEADPTTIDKVVAACLQHGVATRVLRAHAVHISPPFVITEEQIDAMVDGIGNALEDVASATAGVPA